MKTTVELPEALLSEAKRVAAEEKTSVKALIQEGLQRVLELRTQARKQFRLRKASVSGKEPRDQFAEGGWEAIRSQS